MGKRTARQVERSIAADLKEIDRREKDLKLLKREDAILSRKAKLGVEIKSLKSKRPTTLKKFGRGLRTGVGAAFSGLGRGFREVQKLGAQELKQRRVKAVSLKKQGRKKFRKAQRKIVKQSNFNAPSVQQNKGSDVFDMINKL